MPARTPTKLKVVRGTARKDRVNPKEPKPDGHLPQEAPDWLSADARAWWDRLRPILVSLGVATAADPAAAAMLCDALAEYISARDLVVKLGATYETNGKGGLMIRARPEVGIASDAWRRAKLMLTEFGMTPASRSKVSVADGGPADPLEEWERGTGS